MISSQSKFFRLPCKAPTSWHYFWPLLIPYYTLSKASSPPCPFHIPGYLPLLGLGSCLPPSTGSSPLEGTSLSSLVQEVQAAVIQPASSC